MYSYGDHGQWPIQVSGKLSTSQKQVSRVIKLSLGHSDCLGFSPLPFLKCTVFSTFKCSAGSEKATSSRSESRETYQIWNLSTSSFRTSSHMLRSRYAPSSKTGEILMTLVKAHLMEHPLEIR